ncbi:MAG: lysine--tRNA ligase [Chloroflexi bacterium]|nr:lysine--tRNA ligase [Anaerolineaceae bacterium]NMD27488.1 lysine--tRNA ligase [Chloroflexota bacterium]
MLQDEFSELENIRLEKLLRLRAEGVEPYPTTTNRNASTTAAVQAFEAAEAANSTEEVQAVLAGRLRAIRNMGKLSFAHIEDREGKAQLLFRVDEIGEDLLQAFARDFDLGDFIEAEGTMFRTRRGEVTLLVKSYRMLAKALLQLPADKDEVIDGKTVRHATLTDPETRFRQRYVDLAVNPEVREVFRIRSAAVSALRKFLDGLGFLEVETPILQPIYGGAAARPFVTHHNELDQDLYLRISFELYLKRLIVGGLERVYEIGRDFRNEGVSYKHNPEFTQLEFYMAYADYRDIMEITEQMVSSVAQQVLGTQIIHFDGHEINLTPPWKRLEIRQALLEQTGIDISQHQTAAELSAVLREKGIQHNPNAPRGKMIGDMMEQFLEPLLIQPTFLYDYPRDISPLAKNKPGDPQTVERFEGFIAGMELCNAFTELNDPLEQEKRFLELGRAYAEGDEERHPMDEDYLRALAYGMPPTGGFGMGVDRFAMLLTGHHNIREVILFPPLRDTNQA